MKDLDQLKNKRILLIEDEKVIRENIADTLKFFFKEVYTAEDGLDGLDQYEKYLPDIVMSDLKMPHMDGLELIKLLLERGSSSYMIIVSAHTDTELLLDALHQGVDRYLVKPIDEKKLFESFEAYIDKNLATSIQEVQLNNGLILNLDKSQAQHENKVFNLSRKELLLVKLLLTDQKKAFSYQEIEYHVWGSKSMSLSALRTVVRDLRKKLGSSYINNVSGIGYSFS